MWRRAVHKVHRWAGLAALVFLVVETLTGVIVTFHDEIHRWAYPMLDASEVTAPRRPMDELVAKLRAELPEMRIQRAAFPHDARELIWFRVAPRDGSGGRRFVLVNPVSGEILARGPLVAFPCELALTLHASLLAGSTGVTLVGWGGVALFLLGVSGVLLWWPRSSPLMKHLTVRWRAPRTVLLLDLHKVIGIIAVAMLLMLSLTGAMIALRAWLPEPPKQTSLYVRDSSQASADSMSSKLEWAQGLHPGSTLSRVFFDDRAGFVTIAAIRLNGPDLPHGRAFDEVTFDAAAPDSVTVSHYERTSSMTRVLDWMLPLHSGEVAGIGGRSLVFLGGWALLLISITGAWMWWERRALKRRVGSRSAT